MNRYEYISTATTTVIKTDGPGTLHTISIGETAAGAITVYDSDTAAGDIIFVAKASVAEQTFIIDAHYNNGLTVLTAAGSKLTLTYT